MTQLHSDLIRLLGEQNVVVQTQRCEDIGRTTTLFNSIPDVVVYPETHAQVQAVMRFGQEHQMPVWVVSQGKNWGYGSKAAAYQGGITMILEKMNRILHVDEKLSYAILEPGVTYQQLNQYLKDHKLKLWADCTGSTMNGSVIGNALDKGRGLTPYADHFGSLCGMEVVLPSGELLTTGGGPLPQYRCWNTYKWGIGPYVDGLFTQSNLGIVVKAGVWLMPEPEAFDFLAFQYMADDSQLGNLIEDIRWLIAENFLPSRPHLANDFAMLCILSQYPYELLQGRTHLSPEALLKWRKKHGVGSWSCGLGLYGTKETVRLQRKMIRKKMGKYGRLWSLGRALRGDWLGQMEFKLIKLMARLGGASEAALDQLLPAANLYRGIPTDDFAKQVYVKHSREKPKGKYDPNTDGCGLMWTGPIIPFTAEDVDQLISASKEVFERQGFDFFLELIFEGPRSIICLMGIFFDKMNPDESKRAGIWYQEMRDMCLKLGYPPYRESLSSTSNALDLNPGMKDLVANLKHALDPKNILAPSHYGSPASSVRRE